MGKSELLRELRERTGAVELTAREFWKAPGLNPGVTKGIVAELLGNARTEWLLSIFAENPAHFIFWCEREATANPAAIHQRGVALERIKFVNTSADLQQPLRLALESQFYPFIVAPNNFEDVRTYQRFHLLTEKSKSTLFLLAAKKFSTAWPISLQLEINFCDSGFAVDVIRQKHGARV